MVTVPALAVKLVATLIVSVPPRVKVPASVLVKAVTEREPVLVTAPVLATARVASVEPVKLTAWALVPSRVTVPVEVMAPEVLLMLPPTVRGLAPMASTVAPRDRLPMSVPMAPLAATVPVVARAMSDVVPSAVPVTDASDTAAFDPSPRVSVTPSERVAAARVMVPVPLEIVSAAGTVTVPAVPKLTAALVVEIVPARLLVPADILDTPPVNTKPEAMVRLPVFRNETGAATVPPPLSTTA